MLTVIGLLSLSMAGYLLVGGPSVSEISQDIDDTGDDPVSEPDYSADRDLLKSILSNLDQPEEPDPDMDDAAKAVADMADSQDPASDRVLYPGGEDDGPVSDPYQRDAFVFGKVTTPTLVADAAAVPEPDGAGGDPDETVRAELAAHVE